MSGPDELAELVFRGIISGAVSWVARKIFEGSEKELKELQNTPPEFTNRDREEMLADYIDEITEEIGDFDNLTVDEGVKIIRSRAGVFATELHLKVRRLSSEGEKPKGV